MTRQHWDPRTYAKKARFVSEHGKAVIELLAPVEGERVLDLGCGDGVLTEMLVRAGCTVVGIDSSPEQVEGTRSLGIDARLGHAEAMTFDAEFDAVFSNAVLHWIPKPDKVLTAVHRALKPRGRFVGEFGGAGNVITIRTALAAALARHGFDSADLNPWFFPTAEEYGELLEWHGFSVKTVSLFPRLTLLPGDVGDWLDTFAQPFLTPLEERDRLRLRREVVEQCRETLYDPSQGWFSDYVRLRFCAVAA